MKNKKTFLYLLVILVVCFFFSDVVKATTKTITIEELKEQIVQIQQRFDQLQQQPVEDQKEVGEDEEDSNKSQDNEKPEQEIKPLTSMLRYGDSGEQVEKLQQMLKQDPEIYPEGIVSGYFGPLTEKAVNRFQKKYREDILAPWKIEEATGFVGSMTLKKLNELYKDQCVSCGEEASLGKKEPLPEANESQESQTAETQQKTQQEVTILSGEHAGIYLTEKAEAGVYETFEDIPQESLELIPEEAGLEESEFQGYIIQFKEKSLISEWQELHNQAEKKAITSVQESAQFDSYRSDLNLTFQSYKTQLKAKISGFDQKIEREFKHVFNGIALDISQEEAEEIEKLDYIKEVFPNYKVRALLTDSVSLIRADEVWDLGYTGEGITIAVIDTGIDYTHPDLGGCLGSGCKVIGGYDFINNDSDPMDDHGHGTHCAGIAASNGNLKGVAPDAKLLAYKVLNNYGSGTFDQVIAGIERAVDPNQDGDYSDHADIISLSLGCFNPVYCHQDDPPSLAVDEAVKAGVIAVVAAGNSGNGYETIGSPGTARKALTVGASCMTDQVGVHTYCDDKIAKFSSRGPTAAGVKPDVVAPGVEICSSQWDSAWNDKKCFDDEHTSISGTSMATPHIAGAAALIKQAHPDWSPEEIKMVLRNTALDLGYDIYTQGYGMIDVLKAVQAEKPSVAVLYNPVEIDGENFNVKGTVAGDSFNLYYVNGKDPEAKDWIEICSGLAVVTDDTLCNWDLRYLEDGEYTLKLIAKMGTEESEEFGFVNLDNIKITYPKDIRGEANWTNWQLRQAREVLPTWEEINIEGKVMGFGFKNYTIEWCDENYVNCTDKEIILTDNGNYPVNQNVLGKWNVASFTNPGYHYLKLTVYFEDRQEQVEDIKIYIDPAIHEGWPKEIDTIEGFEGYVLPLNGQPTLADINNNGQDNIIIAYGKNIHVFTHDGSYVSGWPREITNPYNIWGGMMQSGPAVADLNGDGHNEIVVGDNAGYLHILNYDGTYWDGWPKKLSDSKYPYIGPVSIEDINKDGELEMMFYNLSGYVYAVDVNGNYLEGFPAYPGGSFPKESIAVADLNNDGYGELISIFFNELYLLDHKGNILDGWPKAHGKYVKSVLGNMNDDDETEIVLGTLDGIYIYSWDGSVLDFIPIANLSHINGLSVGDIDKDGKLEIAMITNYGQGLHLFEKRDEGWQEADGFPIRDYSYRDGGDSSSHPLLGDLDTDIENEISIAIVDGDINVPRGELSELFAYSSDGSVVQNFPVKLNQTVFGTGSPMGDIDGDGKNELMTYTTAGSLLVWDMDGKSEDNEWPVFYHDSRHTNFYGEFLYPVEDSLTVISPNGGEKWNGKEKHKILWTSEGNIYSQLDVFIGGYDSNGNQIDDWKLIETEVSTAQGYFYWTPSNAPLNLPSCFSSIPVKYKIKIKETNGETDIIEDVSDDYFTIDFDPSIVITSPKGGEQITENEYLYINWEKYNWLGNKVGISLGGYSENGNQIDDWKKIITVSEGTAGLSWVPSQSNIFSTFSTLPVKYNIKLKEVLDSTETRTAAEDISDGYFTVDFVVAPSITVVSPNGGIFRVTKSSRIIWEQVEMEEKEVDILLAGYDENGKQIDDWKVIQAGVSADREFIFWLPRINDSVISSFSTFPDEYKIKIKETNGETDIIEDVSDDYFTIDFETLLTVISPNGGEEWVIGETYDITWESNGLDKVTIYLYGLSLRKTIVSNISASQGFYSWEISSDIDPDARYKIVVGCTEGSHFYSDDSDNYFSIVSEPPGNLPPVIDSIQSPAQLETNEKGTWIIEMHDPENESLTCTVSWGYEDVSEIANPDEYTIDSNNHIFVTFTHSYSEAGTYTIEFVVTDESDNTTKDSVIVEVIEEPPSIEESPFIIITSPKGGEQITKNEYLYIDWEKGNWTGSEIDISLGGYDNNGNQIDDWKKIMTVSERTAGLSWVPSQSDIFSTFSTLPVKYKIKLKEVLDSTETRTAVEDILNGYFTVDFVTSVNITSPKGGDRWYIGDTHDITWQAEGEGLITISIGPYLGGDRKTIAENVSASLGKYSWEVGTSLNGSVDPADDYKIVIINSTGLVGNWSGKFSITEQEQEEPLILRNIKGRLANISQTFSELVKGIKELLRGR